MHNFNLTDFTTYKQNQQKITMLTAYDYYTAAIAASSNIDVILVGDSLGMVIQGNQNTVSVTLDEMIYHAKMVRRGAPNAFVVVDMPYLSYHTTIEESIRNAGSIMQQGLANAVKLEVNSQTTINHVRALIDAQIPVMGHVGLTPQSVNLFGGFKIQGKTDKQAEHITTLAQQLENAGIFAIVLECIPTNLAKQITNLLNIATIGIGSGADCDGQVLVFHDLMGMNTNYIPQFAKLYMNGRELMQNAIKEYIHEVKSRSFPS